MPRKDRTRGPRRDISMKGVTHQRLSDWCAERRLGLGPTVEAWIHERLDREGAPIPLSVDEELQTDIHHPFGDTRSLDEHGQAKRKAGEA